VYVSDLYSTWDFIVLAKVRAPSFGVYGFLCHMACDVDVCQYYSACAAGHRMQLADKGHAACLAALQIPVRASSRIVRIIRSGWDQECMLVNCITACSMCMIGDATAKTFCY